MPALQCLHQTVAELSGQEVRSYRKLSLFKPGTCVVKLDGSISKYFKNNFNTYFCFSSRQRTEIQHEYGSAKFYSTGKSAKNRLPLCKRITIISCSIAKEVLIQDSGLQIHDTCQATMQVGSISLHLAEFLLNLRLRHETLITAELVCNW